MTSPMRVFGGLLHQVYRLQTAHGTFALKLLNPTILRYPNVRENFRLSERIAAVVAAAGLPAVAALPAAVSIAADKAEPSPLHDISDGGAAAVMLYPWIDAKPNDSFASAGAERTRKIGSLLGRIHSLDLRFAELQPPPAPDTSETSSPAPQAAEWAALIDRAERMQLPFAPRVRALLPQINAWRQASREARTALLASSDLRPTWVISHGDLDQKNVLWDWDKDESPHLIDWESAGYVQPAIEAVCAALDWSGQVVGRLDVAAFNAFLEGYRSAAPALTPHEIGCGLRAYSGNWCGWLQFNLQRAVDAATADPEEQALGRREVESTLVLLASAAETLPTLEQRYRLSVTAKRGLTALELAQVRELAKEVERADSIALKLNWELMIARRADDASDFCGYDEGGRLVGYLPLDGEGEELEVTAMVAPTYRRRGIFRRLVDAAKQEARQHGAKRLLLVNYRASVSGAAAVKALRLPYVFSEYAMAADAETIPSFTLEAQGAIRLVTVDASDAASLAQLSEMLTRTFGPGRRSPDVLAEELRRSGVRYFFAERDGQRIGQIGVIDVEGSDSLYLRAVGIVPEQRHRGNGRSLLSATLGAMWAEGYTRFSLDVATSNANALSLYESCGFRTTNIYDYHEVQLTEK